MQQGRDSNKYRIHLRCSFTQRRIKYELETVAVETEIAISWKSAYLVCRNTQALIHKSYNKTKSLSEAMN